MQTRTPTPIDLALAEIVRFVYLRRRARAAKRNKDAA